MCYFTVCDGNRTLEGGGTAVACFIKIQAAHVAQFDTFGVTPHAFIRIEVRRIRKAALPSVYAWRHRFPESRASFDRDEWANHPTPPTACDPHNAKHAAERRPPLHHPTPPAESW